MLFAAVFFVGFSAGFCQVEVVRPRTVPPRVIYPDPPEVPGIRLPKPPEPHTIQPLPTPRKTTGPVFGQVPKNRLPPPEEPPVVGRETLWEQLLSLTLQPVVLSPVTRVRIMGDAVAVREGPGLDFRKTGTLSEGEVVGLLDVDDDWYRVEIGSATDGWIDSRYAKKLDLHPAIVTGERVNLRSGPGTDTLPLGTLYRGAIVLAGIPGSHWTEVHTPNLKRAFIYSDYLRPLPPEIPLNPKLEPQPAPPTPVASLARLTAGSTDEAAFLLSVWGDEWVKGGKAGLLYLSTEKPSPLTGKLPDPPRFEEGVFFQKTLFRDDWPRALGPVARFPEGTQAVTVVYLRGRKKKKVWMFEFCMSGLEPAGRFALVCQEGPQSSSYFLLEVEEVR